MKSLFNEGWKFWEAEYGTGYETAMEHLADFKDVEIPHDYLIHDTSNLYKDSTGWYVKEFELSDKDAGRRISLIFDGIYMDSIVYVNGKAAGEWKYGYSQFILDITDYVLIGKNTLAVAARCKFPNTRWYSGAGIYRNVWLCNYDRTYIPENGIYVHNEKCDDGYLMYVSAEVIADSRDAAGTVLSYELFDDNAQPVALLPKEITDANKAEHTDKCFLVQGVKEWDVKAPVLYTLKVKLQDNKDGRLIQEECVCVGFRDVRMDPDHGFFLNGRNMKLNGVCLHHDLGALGSAFNKTAMRRRLIQLQEMGVNALRLTHNMYDPQVMFPDQPVFVIS